MNKNLLVAIAVGVGIYFIYNSMKNKTGSKQEPTTPPLPGTSPTTTANENFPLKIGSRGERVKKLQKFLNDSWSGHKLKVDGVFGLKTEGAVIKETGASIISEKYYNDFIAPSTTTSSGWSSSASGSWNAPVVWKAKDLF